eukprot:1077441-Alexandrium_andersonii.AAC.1
MHARTHTHTHTVLPKRTYAKDVLNTCHAHREPSQQRSSPALPRTASESLTGARQAVREGMQPR